MIFSKADREFYIEREKMIRSVYEKQLRKNKWEWFLFGLLVGILNFALILYIYTAGK